MIFPFCIEKEAEIYCTSTKVALKQAVRANGWNIQDEDGVSWWIGLYAQSYIRAMNNNEHSFDEIFKTVFIKYFEIR